MISNLCLCNLQGIHDGGQEAEENLAAGEANERKEEEESDKRRQLQQIFPDFQEDRN